MEEYQNILVPVDGSQQSEKAFLEAVNIAQRNHGTLTLVTVIDTTSFRGTTGANSVGLLDEVRKKSEAILQKLIQEIPNERKIHYTSRIVAGNPKREIVDLAQELETDLIVMGATGLGALSLMLLGSTTAYVVNQAPCNVMVVK